MKALIVERPGSAKFIEAERPKVGPGDALCRVVYSGICGTDLSIFTGDMNLVREGYVKYPVRIGHEWSGIVEEVGCSVKNLRPGDKVVSDSGVTCGVCEHCLKGDYDSCRNGRALGTIGNCWEGSFAEYTVFPERHLYKVPDGVSMDDAALTEPMSIALSGVKTMDVKGRSVLVIGTGAIGLSAAALVKYYGASKVIVSGRKPFKLDVARQVGADEVINATQEDLVEFVMKVTGDAGVDAVIETSGDANLLNQCVAAAKQGAPIVLIGFFESRLNDFDIAQFMMKRQHLYSALGKIGLAREIGGILASGKINVHPLITHRFCFEDTIDAMKSAGERNDTKIKMMVQISNP